MKLQLKGGGSVSVSDEAFAGEYNEALVHQVVTAVMAGARRGTKAQKDRAQVRGGGAKPWRQKGTGRARAGSIRSPIWRGGGRAFAARPRDHGHKVNRKMYRGAMRALLAELLRQDRLLVVKALELEESKTRELAARLKELGVTDVLIVLDELDERVFLSARNLPHVDVALAATVDPVSLLRNEHVLATVDALRKLEERVT